MGHTFFGGIGLEARAQLEDLDVFRLHQVLESVEIDHALPRRTVVSGWKLDIVQVKTAEPAGHRLEVQPVVNEAEVLLDLRVADVVPVADIGVIKPLKEKVPVGVYRDFLEGFADLDTQFDAPQARLFGDPLEHPVGKVACFGLLFLAGRFRNSALGLVFVFALTGFMGLTLGPIVGYYINAIPNGDQLVMTALGGTGVIFLGLSAYALKSRKDFSFMGGMLFAGILVAFLAGLGAAVFSIPALSLAVSAMFIILMSGMILYQTSAIIHGGETNYIMATITLYVSIYNLFLSLLQILGIFGGDD